MHLTPTSHTQVVQDAVQPWTLVWQAFKALPSTQTFLHNQDNLKENCLYLCTAEQQTAGIGQRQNVWIAPAQTGIWYSIAALCPLNTHPWTCMIAAHVARCLATHGLNPQIKWPNDILLNDQKCAGILIDTERCLTHQKIIMGLGMNLNPHPDLPPESTALNLHANIDTEKLFLDLLQSIATTLKTPDQTWKAQWRKYMAYQGESVSLKILETTITGTLMGINDQGAVEIQTNTGLKHAYTGSLIRM